MVIVGYSGGYVPTAAALSSRGTIRTAIADVSRLHDVERATAETTAREERKRKIRGADKEALVRKWRAELGVDGQRQRGEPVRGEVDVEDLDGAEG